jgi:hypothetical protein
MPGVEFEPTIPAFELAKTVHALDRAATVIGSFILFTPASDFNAVSQSLQENMNKTWDWYHVS